MEIHNLMSAWQRNRLQTRLNTSGSHDNLLQLCGDNGQGMLRKVSTNTNFIGFRLPFSIYNCFHEDFCRLHTYVGSKLVFLGAQPYCRN